MSLWLKRHKPDSADTRFWLKNIMTFSCVSPFLTPSTWFSESESGWLVTYIIEAKRYLQFDAVLRLVDVTLASQEIHEFCAIVTTHCFTILREKLLPWTNPRRRHEAYMKISNWLMIIILVFVYSYRTFPYVCFNCLTQMSPLADLFTPEPSQLFGEYAYYK